MGIKKKWLNPVEIFRFLFIKSTFKTTERDKLIEKISKFTESPLIILAFAMIPLLLGPYIWDLSDGEKETFNSLDNIFFCKFYRILIISRNQIIAYLNIY